MFPSFQMSSSRAISLSDHVHPHSTILKRFTTGLKPTSELVKLSYLYQFQPGLRSPVKGANWVQSSFDPHWNGPFQRSAFAHCLLR